VVYANNTRPCTSNFAANVTVGANHSHARRTVALALIARNHTSVFVGRFYVSIAPAISPTTIQSIGLSPANVPAAGGVIIVTGTITNATSCQLKLLSHQSFPVVYANNTRTCPIVFTARITVGANPSHVPRTVAFALTARNQSSSFTGQFYVHLAARTSLATTTVPSSPGTTTTVPPAVTTTAPPAVTAALAVNPGSLPATGGQVNFVYSSPNGTTCSLSSSPTIWTGANPTPVNCNGSYQATIPANTAQQPQTWTVVFSATGSHGTAATSTQELTEQTVVVANPTINPYWSANWSGYETDGGPFTSVSGTFTVPSLTTGTNCDQETSEWVGIDGANSSDLIQAGIDEQGSDPNTGNCTNGKFWVASWWEILPAYPTPAPIPGNVSAGDKVTVTLAEITGTTWSITITDDTTNQSYTTDQNYTGPGNSAEWIVESPGDYNTPCDATGNNGPGSCPMAPYSPSVLWSALSLPAANSVTQIDNLTCAQPSAPWGNTALGNFPNSDLSPVSSPSTVDSLADLLADGFNVSYGGGDSNSQLVHSTRLLNTAITPTIAPGAGEGSTHLSADSLHPQTLLTVNVPLSTTSRESGRL
jgi:hypothetical protein